MCSRFRMVLGCLGAFVLATFAVTASAQASLLTPTATNCGTPHDSQAFLAWGDPSEYYLAPDGNFADAAATWSLSGGAMTVAGGDGYSLGGAAPSSRSLALPDNSSATTPTFCVGVNQPTFRFFAENSGSPTSTLLVSATVATTLGATVTVPVADITATSTWNPTAIEPLIANLLPLLPGNQTPITLSFAPVGQGGNWQIDDVYVDPWTRGE
jgi:hypothetical protein